jgi:uncharacterized protein YigA (DUF484 family)
MTTPLTHPITEDDIADYLGSNPEFFERHAELLAAVHLSSPHNQRAVSLQERQAEMLREKIKVLEHRMMDMIRHGNDNVLLSGRLLRWAASLFGTADASELPGRITSDIATRFAVPQVALRVWDVTPALAQAPFAQGVSDEVKQFAASLDEPYCGLNTGFEVTDWLPDPAAAASLAILALRGLADATGPGPLIGLLVLASPDSQRFNSAMGTEFLERIAELCGAALARLRQA